jgi:type I restriction enzyme S subunit
MTWREVSLKEICDVDWGNTKLTKSSYVNNGKYLAVSAAGADGLIDHFEHEANVPVLSAIGAQCGRMFYPGSRFTAIKNTITLTPKNNMVDGKYLYYLFTHVELPQRGAGQPFISKGDIETFRVSIPTDLNEQREIVEKLNFAFDDLDLLEGNLRVSQGKLDELFQSLISEAISSSSDLRMTPLKELCTLFTDGDWIESKDQSDKGIRLVQTGNVGSGFFKDRIEKSRWISEETFQRLRCTEIVEGDVLVSRLPDPVGRACLVPAMEDRAITAVDCTIIRFDPEQIRPRYFVYYSQSSKYASAIGPLISGATRQRISREKLGTILVPVPNTDIQDEIVGKLDGFSSEVTSLKKLAEARRQSLHSLRQSVLSSLFKQDAGAV